MNYLPIELFMYVLKLTQLQDPTFLFEEDEQMMMEVCLKINIPLRCIDYKDGIDSTEIMTLSNGPIFVNRHDHDLSFQLNELNETLLAGKKLWLMPLDYNKNIHLRLDSRVFFYEKKNMSDNYTVYEGYAIEGVINISPLFEWFPSKTDHIKVFEKESVLQRRSDLRGVELISDYPAELDPFVKYIRGSSGDIVQVVGYYADILNDLEDHFKFTIKRIASQSGWGNQLDNGSFSGLMGQLLARKIDMAQPFAMSLERQPHISYCWPLVRGSFTLITNAPTKPKLDMWAFMKIFPVLALVVICITVIFASIIYALANNNTILQGLEIQLRFAIQLGYDFPTHGRAIKILFLTTATSFLFLFILFNCDLTANMTSDPLPIDVKNFQDVIDEQYRVVTFKHSLSVNYFKNAPEGSAMQWVYRNKMLTNDPPENALTENYIDMFKVINSQEKTLIYHDPMTYSDKPYWRHLYALKDVKERCTFYVTIAMTKESEFHEIINYYILKMQENGLDTRVKLRWMYNANTNYEGIQATPLTGENLIFPFVLLVLGINAAITTCVFEWLIKKCGGLGKVQKINQLTSRQMNQVRRYLFPAFPYLYYVLFCIPIAPSAAQIRTMQASKIE